MLHGTKLDGKLGAQLCQAQCGLGDNAGSSVILSVDNKLNSYYVCKLGAQAKYEPAVSQADLETAGKTQQRRHGASQHQQKW